MPTLQRIITPVFFRVLVFNSIHVRKLCYTFKILRPQRQYMIQFSNKTLFFTDSNHPVETVNENTERLFYKTIKLSFACMRIRIFSTVGYLLNSV